MKLGSIQIIIK